MLLIAAALRAAGALHRGRSCCIHRIARCSLLGLRGQAALRLAPAGTYRANSECAAARRYIDEHFTEPLSLDTLAEVAHVNKYHLSHTFRREYGISPINYLIMRRIREGRHMLEHTSYSLSQIAHSIGFSSPSYFSQSFRKAEGLSPAGTVPVRPIRSGSDGC